MQPPADLVNDGARAPALLTHDLSFSGAPLALLALAKALRRLGLRPRVVPLAGGPLAAVFAQAGIDLVPRVNPASVSYVIANTVLTVPTALQFKPKGVPVAAWIHETTYVFQTLKVHPPACGLHLLDTVLMPARFQFQDFASLIPAERIYQMRNCVRQEWFRPPAGDPTYAVTGPWELRKGQARLVDLAREAGATCRFKFIGADRAPAIDRYIGAGAGQHLFTGKIAPEVARLQIARSAAFVSCSEAEVQPLSVVEAVMAGRPALLSDIAAHRALAQDLPNVFLYDRTSPASFADGLRRLRAAVPDEAAGREASAQAHALFSESAFDLRLAALQPLLRGESTATGQPAALQDR